MHVVFLVYCQARITLWLLCMWFLVYYQARITLWLLCMWCFLSIVKHASPCGCYACGFLSTIKHASPCGCYACGVSCLLSSTHHPVAVMHVVSCLLSSTHHPVAVMHVMFLVYCQARITLWLLSMWCFLSTVKHASPCGCYACGVSCLLSSTQHPVAVMHVVFFVYCQARITLWLLCMWCFLSTVKHASPCGCYACGVSCLLSSTPVPFPTSNCKTPKIKQLKNCRDVNCPHLFI